MRKKIRDKMVETLSLIVEAEKKINLASCVHPVAAPFLNEFFSDVETVEIALYAGLTEIRADFYGERIATVKQQLFTIEALLAEGKTAVREVKKLKEELENLIGLLKAEEEVKQEIVFLPYKASMWDSMESIWVAAKEDTSCNVHVVPIPYYDRWADQSFGDMHYEADQLPSYVPTEHYTEYDISKELPDVIYIHNPYDDMNYVTSIHPEFYSDKLKKYTEKLVYVPYFILGSYTSLMDGGAFCCNKGTANADIVVAQSEVHKQMLVANGKSAGKILVAGNPKLDYVLNHLDDTVIPEEWKTKIGDKKAVLFCMSVGSFLAWADNDCIELYDRIIDTMLHKYNKAVIYRPHPLLQATIKSMRPDKYEEYQNFLKKYEDMDGFVLDTLADSMPAIAITESMFSDYSSLCFSYMVTGKPVGIIVYGYNKEQRDKLVYALDYRGCYFVDIGNWLAWPYWQSKGEEGKRVLSERIYGNPRSESLLDLDIIFGWIVDRYLHVILTGSDEKAQERINRFCISVKNINGMAGKEVHFYVKGKEAKR